MWTFPLAVKLVVLLPILCKQVACEPPSCENSLDPEIPEDAKICHARRHETAEKQHVPILVPFGTEYTLDLPCPICKDENLTEFVWFWIPRSRIGDLFFPNETVAGIQWYLNEDMMEPVEIIDPSKADPCLAPSSVSLHFRSFSSETHLGTYICMNLASDTHPANRIWYHVDTIQPYGAVADYVQIKAVEEMDGTVQTLPQLQELQRSVDSHLESLPNYEDSYYHPIYLTSQVSNNLPNVITCGPLLIRSDRSCVIRVRTEGLDFTNIHPEAILMYNILRQAFDFLISHHAASNPLEEKIRRAAAKRRADQLGFVVNLNRTDIFAPCGYTLFKHLPTLNDTIRPLSKRGSYTTIKYEVACKELDPWELLNMALDKDVTRMKSHILGFEDVRYMKVEKIVIEGTKNLRLECKPEKPVNCSGTRPELLWKTKNGLTFERRTMMKERVYMSGTCELVMQVVQRQDADEYRCFLRDMRNPTKWSEVPYMAYGFKVEKAVNEIPDPIDIQIGLIILGVWAACVTVLWIFLSIYNYHILNTAIEIALARQKLNEEMRAEQRRKLLSSTSSSRSSTEEKSPASGENVDWEYETVGSGENQWRNDEELSPTAGYSTTQFTSTAEKTRDVT